MNAKDANYGRRLMGSVGRTAALFSVLFFIWLIQIPAGADLQNGVVQITRDANDQLNPQIFGDRIVWNDFRTNVTLRNYNQFACNKRWDVYSYDISTGIESRIYQGWPLTYTGPMGQQCGGEAPLYESWYPSVTKNKEPPRIFVDIAVFGSLQSSGNPHVTHAYKAIIYDFNTGLISKVPSPGKNQMDPQVLGSKVYFADDRNGGRYDTYHPAGYQYDIYEYDLVTGATSQISSSIFDQTKPVVFGEGIEWWDEEKGYMLHDPATRITARLMETAAYADYLEVCGGICPIEHGTGYFAYMKSVAGRPPEIYVKSMADGKEARVTLNDYEDKAPHAQGKRIVWNGFKDGNWDVFMYDLEQNPLNFTEPKKLQLATSRAKRGRPKLSGDYAIWSVAKDTALSGIHLYNMRDGTETVIDQSPEDERDFPAIHGDIAVWHGLQAQGLQRDVFMHNISSGESFLVTTDPSDQSHPDIYGTKIVWQDDREGDFDIHMYDLVTFEESLISQSWGDDVEPQIDGGYIVYTSRDGGNWGIELYDLNLGLSRQVVSNPFPTRHPAISGTIIAWQEMNGSNFSVQFLDMLTGKSKRIFQIQTDRTLEDEDMDITGLPQTNGRLIAWQDPRRDKDQIYVYDTVTETEVRVTGTYNPYILPSEHQVAPAIDGNNLIWASDDSDRPLAPYNGYVYLFDLSQLQFSLPNGPFASPSPGASASPSTSPEPDANATNATPSPGGTGILQIPTILASGTPPSNASAGPTRRPISSLEPDVYQPSVIGTHQPIKIKPEPSIKPKKPTTTPRLQKLKEIAEVATGIQAWLIIIGIMAIAIAAYYIYWKKTEGSDEEGEK